MQSILEYITLNYTWILGVSIIILLAVIGYYADKTNFGQGKQTEDINKDKINEFSLEGKRMEDLLEQNKDNNVDVEKNDVISPGSVANTDLNNVNTKSVNNDKDSAINNSGFIYKKDELVNDKLNSLENSEQKFNNFEKEFNELLPKKEIMDDELLDEIDNLSLDKTQKINLSNIPDLDDVELPRIKTLKFDEEDIWKF